MTLYTLRRNFILAILFIATLGILDTSYLTFEHYSSSIPPCSVSIWVDCGKVLSSRYSMVGPIPLSLLGLAFYSSMFGLAAARLAVEKEMTIKDLLWKVMEKFARPRSVSLQNMLFYVQVVATSIGIAVSTYLVYLQVEVLGSICLYCMFSATLSLLLFVVTFAEYFTVHHQNRLS
jgi:uncharacterized membrane protein